MADRVTRPVTPFVEIIHGEPTNRVEVIRKIEAGDIVAVDGRIVLRLNAIGGAPHTRILLDPDSDFYGYIARSEPADLRAIFEVHLKERWHGLLPAQVRGLTVVVPWAGGGEIPHWPDVSLALAVTDEWPATALPNHVSEVHVTLPGDQRDTPDLSQFQRPVAAILPLHRADSFEVLPRLLHGMGTGRLDIRELRLRIDPRSYQVRDRRSPFCSEVAEAIATAAGCNTGQLTRELAFRERVLHRGSVRHFRPDPYFVTWLFRGHPTKGLVPAANGFPVPRRASRRELLRTAPESEHERILAYLELMESHGSRLQALENRELYAVSVHYLPNPDLPIRPEHGGIVVMDKTDFVPLGS